MADAQTSDGDRGLRVASFRYRGESDRGESDHGASDLAAPDLHSPVLDTFGRGGARLLEDGVDLGSLVARQVIPRLRGVRAPSIAADRGPARPRGPIVERAKRSSEDEKALLVDRLLANNIMGARATIETALKRGVSLETVCLDLIQPAADRLQQFWREDHVGLAEVTLALLDLRTILCRLADDGPVDAEPAVSGRRVLLAAPRRGHDVGAMAIGQMIGAAVYRRGGWDTWIEQDLTAAFRAETIGRYWFDMVELFVGTDRDPDALAISIRAIRRASPNPGLGIMLRGANFSGYPDFVGQVGADLASPQPRASLMLANHFVTFPNLGTESSARVSVSGQASGRRRKIRLT